MYDKVEITYDVNKTPHIQDVFLDGQRMKCIYADVNKHPSDEYSILTMRMYVKKVHIKKLCVRRSLAGGI